MPRFQPAVGLDQVEPGQNSEPGHRLVSNDVVGGHEAIPDPDGDRAGEVALPEAVAPDAGCAAALQAELVDDLPGDREDRDPRVDAGLDGGVSPRADWDSRSRVFSTMTAACVGTP